MPPQEEVWSATRLLAQPFVLRLVREPISGAEGLRRLRDIGLGYRTTDFYSDWRRERGLARYEYECSVLRRETTPPDRVFTDTEWPGLTNRYLYVFSLAGTDRITGEPLVDEFRAIGTDTLLTVGEAEDEYWTRWLEGVSDPDKEIETATLTAVRRRTW